MQNEGFSCIVDGVILAFIFTLIGLVCIYLEFFLPGIVIGVAGAIIISVGMWFFASGGTPILWDLAYLALTALLTAGVCKLALWQIRRSAPKNSFYLSKDLEGYSSTESNPAFIDKAGEALSDLRPSGYVQIEGKEYQAVAHAGFIERGASVRVTADRGSHLIVRRN